MGNKRVCVPILFPSVFISEWIGTWLRVAHVLISVQNKKEHVENVVGQAWQGVVDKGTEMKARSLSITLVLVNSSTERECEG